MFIHARCFVYPRVRNARADPISADYLIATYPTRDFLPGPRLPIRTHEMHRESNCKEKTLEL